MLFSRCVGDNKGKWPTKKLLREYAESLLRRDPDISRDDNSEDLRWLADILHEVADVISPRPPEGPTAAATGE